MDNIEVGFQKITSYSDLVVEVSCAVDLTT